MQVDPDSLDIDGVTIATARPALSNSRLGSAYASFFQAAHPVWFHPIYDGRFLMINSLTWNAGAPIGGIPGGYSSPTVSTVPSWLLVNGPSGRASPPVEIPFLTSGLSDQVVIGGASRPLAALYLLHQATYGGSANAVLQRISVNPNGSITPAQEEVLPKLGRRSDDSTWVSLPWSPPTGATPQIPQVTESQDGYAFSSVSVVAQHVQAAAPTITNTVIFNRGVRLATPYIYVYGGDAAGNVYCIRKTWGKVGINTKFRESPQTHPGIAGTQVGWEYYVAGKGYSPDPTHLTPLDNLTTTGPMSFADFSRRSLATTVVSAGASRLGQFWVANSGRPWVKAGAPISLGSTVGTTYLGGTIQLQPLLGANPAAAAMTATVEAGIPYVTSTKVAVAGGNAIDTAWNIQPISL